MNQEDTSMNFSAIIVALIICITLVVIFYTGINPMIKRYLTIRNKEVENKKMELYLDISPELMEKEIDRFIDDYVKRYIVYRFMSKKIIYINDEECDKMVKSVTENILIELSELYLFYLRTLTDIPDDDALIRVVNTKVKNKCIEQVLDYNSSLES